MKNRKYHLLLGIIAAILYLLVSGQTELPHADEQGLIDRANPTLAGIKELHVFTIQPDGEPDKDGLVWAELDKRVQRKLKDANVNVKPMSPFPRPELRIYIDLLKLPDSQKYVFRTQTTLARDVILPLQRNVHMRADVWKTKPLMRTVPIQSMPVELTDAVLEQADAFICAYLAANHPDNRTSDEPANNTISPQPLGHKFVASKNSKIFHKPECSSVKRIKPENLITYNNRPEAINAGKRPCKKCNP